MRDIKFRGISVIDGSFVYGYFVKAKYRRNSPIVYHWIHTPHPKEHGKPSTITMIETNSAKQYTGLKDKNDIEIYEGDPIKSTYYHKVLEVKYINGMFCIEYDDGTLGLPHEQFREVVDNL